MRFLRGIAKVLRPRPGVRPLLPELVVSGSRLSGLQSVEYLVAELQAAGALDEGSGDSLDELIETWRLQHLQILRAYHLDRVQAAQQHLCDLQTRLDAARLRAQLADAQVDELSAVIDGVVEGPEEAGRMHPSPVYRTWTEEAA